MVALVQGTLLEKLPTREEKFMTLESLREACEGKMYTEREYSQCTVQLVKMYEEDGKIDDGTKVIQEIQIETYGSLENKEKVDFILYQMKLVLMRSDYVRLQILSRKISKKAISEKGLEQQKIEYYNFMVKYYIHEKETLEASKAYQTIYDTINKTPVEEDKPQLDPSGQQKKDSFRNFVVYLLISPYTNEKVDLLNIVEAMYPRELEKEELLAKYVHKFLTFEIMPMSEDTITNEFTIFEPF